MANSFGSSGPANTGRVSGGRPLLIDTESELKEGGQGSQDCVKTILGCGDKFTAKINSWLDHSHGRPSDLVAAGLEALDSLNLGVAVTNGSRQLLLTNRTAEQILATRDGVEATTAGGLATLKRCCSPSLGVVIQQVAQGTFTGSPSAKDAVLAVQRPSGKRPLTLLVRAVQGGASQSDALRTVLVFMLDPELSVQATEVGLRQLYGFTISEARLAHLLMSGKTLDECCEHLDIRPSTARMHLGNLFAKAQVDRQGQLISLLLKSVGMVCTEGAEPHASQSGQCADRRGHNTKDGRSQGRAPDTLAAGMEALDLLNVGVGVTNGLCQLLFANHTALQILAARDGLEVTAEGVLGSLKKSCSPSLSALIRQVEQGTLRGTPGDMVLAVRRPSGKRPLTLLVRSLRERSAQKHPTAPAVLVFVLDPEMPVAATESGLRQLYGFTSSEARLAHLLMEGNALDDCCDQLDIRPSTARMHLGNLFAKTGVQRQGQLISLLLKSVGMVRVRSDEGSLKYVTSQDCLSGFLAQDNLPVR
jgi:DNA-binding CsgD family transcriptional regulator